MTVNEYDRSTGIDIISETIKRHCADINTDQMFSYDAWMRHYIEWIVLVLHILHPYFTTCLNKQQMHALSMFVALYLILKIVISLLNSKFYD